MAQKLPILDYESQPSPKARVSGLMIVALLVTVGGAPCLCGGFLWPSGLAVGVPVFGLLLSVAAGISARRSGGHWLGTVLATIGIVLNLLSLAFIALIASWPVPS